MRPPMKPLKPLDEALAELLGHATPLTGVDTVTTFDADGRVLAQDCISALHVPPPSEHRPAARVPVVAGRGL